MPLVSLLFVPTRAQTMVIALLCKQTSALYNTKSFLEMEMALFSLPTTRLFCNRANQSTTCQQSSLLMLKLVTKVPYKDLNMETVVCVLSGGNKEPCNALLRDTRNSIAPLAHQIHLCNKHS